MAATKEDKVRKLTRLGEINQTASTTNETLNKIEHDVNEIIEQLFGGDAPEQSIEAEAPAKGEIHNLSNTINYGCNKASDICNIIVTFKELLG